LGLIGYDLLGFVGGVIYGFGTGGLFVGFWFLGTYDGVFPPLFYGYLLELISISF
jgi:hypothetical protein